MRAADLATVLMKPALTGTMRARQTKARQNSVAKKQWIAYIGVAILTTVLTRTLNEFIERRFAAEDADVG